MRSIDATVFVRFWRVLLVQRIWLFGRLLAATALKPALARFSQLHRYAMHRWRPRDQGCEPQQFLSDGAQNTRLGAIVDRNTVTGISGRHAHCIAECA
jgi:hypothetical protein